MKKSKVKMLNELLLDVLWQSCGEDEDGLLDTRCISCYEETASYLCSEGLLKPVDRKRGRLYFLARKEDLKPAIRGGKI